MFKKTLFIISVFALVFVFGAVNVFADGDSQESCPPVYSAEYGISVPAYCDGRINAFDIMQPVAIYYSYDEAQLLDDDGNAYWADVVSGIQLWSIDADSNGHLALWVPLADLNRAFNATSNVQIAAANGMTLNYSPSADSFWVTAPGYSFVWEAW